MMFCNKCGAKLDEDAVFCTSCGNALRNEKIKSEISGNTEQVTKQIQAETAVSKAPSQKKPLNKRLLALILAIVLVLSGGIALVVYNSQFISFNRFINDEWSPSGYNGYAYLNTAGIVDNDALLLAMGNMDVNNAWYESEQSTVNQALADCILVELDKEGVCCNGDTVTATIRVNYDKLNASLRPQKKLRGKDVYTIKYTIEGLEEPTTIDPFEIVTEVNYNLESKDATVVLDEGFNKEVGNYRLNYFEDGDYTKGLRVTDATSLEKIVDVVFNVDASSYSSTKKVTVNITSVRENVLTQDASVVATSASKEYEPSTIELVRKAEQISVEEFKKLKELANQSVQKSYSDATYQGAYFKFQNNYFWVNRMTFVYATKNAEGETKYIAAYISDLYVDSNGAIVGTNADKFSVDTNALYYEKSSAEVDEYMTSSSYGKIKE